MLAKVSCALVLALVVAHVSAQDKGRQLNWNALSFLTKPGYANPSSASADLQGGSSSVVPSYQSLTGDPDINRDGGSYAPASYGSHDYGYDGGDSYGASGYGYEFSSTPSTLSVSSSSTSRPVAVGESSVQFSDKRQNSRHEQTIGQPLPGPAAHLTYGHSGHGGNAFHRNHLKKYKDSKKYGGKYGYHQMAHAAVPYDYYYDPPGLYELSKHALKKTAKFLFKPYSCCDFLGYDTGPYGRISKVGKHDSLGGFVHALTAFLPIGLFLAAVVPNVITVNGGRRRRSNEDEVNEEVTFPILDMISSYGMRSLQDPGCQAKITCELGAMGGLPEANGLQRSLWIAANYVPERLAGITGAARLMRSIQKRDCTEFACGTD